MATAIPRSEVPFTLQAQKALSFCSRAARSRIDAPERVNVSVNVAWPWFETTRVLLAACECPR